MELAERLGPQLVSSSVARTAAICGPGPLEALDLRGPLRTPHPGDAHTHSLERREKVAFPGESRESSISEVVVIDTSGFRRPSCLELWCRGPWSMRADAWTPTSAWTPPCVPAVFTVVTEEGPRAPWTAVAERACLRRYPW